MAHSGMPDPAVGRNAQDLSPTIPAPELASRRSLRVDTHSRSGAHVAPSSSTAAHVAKRSAHAAVAPSQSSSRTNTPAKKKGGWALNVAVMTVATGIIATMSLPAFAFNPDDSGFGTTAADSMKKAQSQSVEVDGGTPVAIGRETIGATSEAELAAAAAAAAAATAAAAAAENARQNAAVSLSNYAAKSGPSVSDLLSSPPYPNFSLDQVFSVAKQYTGTPYVYGGASPGGFDCSGFVMYVYAQFGISLPHSVSGQAARGTRISIQDARPGDLVIMPGHDGFYAGNGNILDAPDVGRSITTRPIWTSDYYIVRLGI